MTATVSIELTDGGMFAVVLSAPGRPPELWTNLEIPAEQHPIDWAERRADEMRARFVDPGRTMRFRRGDGGWSASSVVAEIGPAGRTGVCVGCGGTISNPSGAQPQCWECVHGPVKPMRLIWADEPASFAVTGRRAA